MQISSLPFAKEMKIVRNFQEIGNESKKYLNCNEMYSKRKVKGKNISHITTSKTYSWNS